jgi:hypothetical protein
MYCMRKSCATHTIAQAGTGPHTTHLFVDLLGRQRVNSSHTSRSSHSFLLSSSHTFLLANTHFLQKPSSFHEISTRSCRPINGSTILCAYRPVACTSSAQRTCTRSSFTDAQVCVLRGQGKSVGAFPATSAQARLSCSRACNNLSSSVRDNSPNCTSASAPASVSASASASAPVPAFALAAPVMLCPNVGIRSSS